jgi:hypothetical protein
MCEAIFWQSCAFLALSIVIMAFVIIRNKRNFNSYTWFCFAFFLAAFAMMLLSAFVNSDDSTGECFSTLLPIAITETEEAFIITIYTLLVFRMVYIYSKVRAPNPSSFPSEKCLSRTIRA